MGAFLARIFKRNEPPKTPIKGPLPRLKNIARNNFRGLIGCIVPIVILSWQTQKGVASKTTELMWMWMFWFFIFQPVHIPVTGLIPIFLLPMTASESTLETCKCYMNENIILYLISSMLILLLNNSGIDRRIALWFICSGDSCQFSGKRLVLKCSSAAFFLSMFSSRLITSSTLIQYMTPALMKMQSSTTKGAEPDFDEMRYIVNNAIQTASGIGSIAIIHSSPATLMFRAIWCEAPPEDKEYPDIFNYLQYSAFAFPVAFLMFIINFVYHMILINWTLGKSMTAGSMVALREILLKNKAEIPKNVSLHEKLSVLFTLLYLLMFMFRWNKWIYGWGEFRRDTTSTEIPRLKDATLAAIFLVVLHILPKGFGFLQVFSAEKKSQLPPRKPESAILWWRFVDKNVNYGYVFLFGGCIAIMNAARDNGLSNIIAENFGYGFTNRPWDASIFLVCFIAALLANLTTAVAACGLFLPFIMCMSLSPAPLPWPSKVYCGALGGGIASSFGFCTPFLYTPGYFCHYTGKVPIRKMIQYSFLTVWICVIILWLALIIWAPYLFDPTDAGIIPVDAPPSAGAAPPPPPADPPDAGI